MADIERTPLRNKRQRRSPLVGETKLFDADPEVFVDTKTAVGMINVQFGAITSPTDMGAMRISGTGPGFVKLGQYVRYKVSTLQSYYRAMLVEYSSTAQCKLTQEERANDSRRQRDGSDVVTATANDMFSPLRS
jgi:hypothetical protein